MKPPKSPWPKIPILNFRSLKKKFYERSYNAGKKWKLNLQLFIHFSILMAGIRPISTKVMYTTLQIVLNTQKINYQENIYWQLLNENESACHTYRVWLLSMGSTGTSVFVCLLLISCSKQRELNYHKLQKKTMFFLTRAILVSCVSLNFLGYPFIFLHAQAIKADNFLPVL